MQCNYNSFFQIINFHGIFLLCSEVPKNWCLPNTGARTQGSTLALVCLPGASKIPCWASKVSKCSNLLAQLGK